VSEKEGDQWFWTEKKNGEKGLNGKKEPNPVKPTLRSAPIKDCEVCWTRKRKLEETQSIISLPEGTLERRNFRVLREVGKAEPCLLSNPYYDGATERRYADSRGACEPSELYCRFVPRNIRVSSDKKGSPSNRRGKEGRGGTAVEKVLAALKSRTG